MPLTDAKLRSLPFENGQRDYPDRDGMFIRVGKQTKTFMLLIRTPRRKRVSLGHFPNLSLAKARELARDKLAQARLVKTGTGSVRFADALDTYYRTHGPQQRQTTRAECQRLLDKHFRAPLGRRNLEDIRTSTIAAILDAIPSHAIRRNSYVFLRAFFNWSYKRGYIEQSPVARLEPPPASKPRERVLTADELVRIWHACPDTEYGSIIKLCILSGQRIGQWMHFKLEYRQGNTGKYGEVPGTLIVWPGAAMKAGRPHTLPLTPMMAELLKEAPFSWKMDGRCKRRLDRASGVTGWVQHDLRRSWATIAAEQLDIEPHIIDTVLAHATGSAVSRTYNRAIHLPKIRKALESYDMWLFGSE